MMANEFQRHVQAYCDAGYPALLGQTPDGFREMVAPLAETLPDGQPDPEAGRVPFVLVVTGLGGETAMARAEWNGKPGVAKLHPRISAHFLPTVPLPDGPAYLLLGVERGDEYRNLTPAAALHDLTARSRTGLTLTEGIALVTLFPDLLRKNHCFSLLASRVPGDKRVPAIWINAQKSPNLGWCWDGNPHTWLGSASCAARQGL